MIVETGTASGGSAKYLASICDLLGQGEIVTIDVAEAERPSHERITYLTASSVAPEVLERVRRVVDGRSPVLVILDSDHSRDHVLTELRSTRRSSPWAAI